MSNRSGVGKGVVEVSRTESTERSYNRRGRLVGRVETVTVTTVERAPRGLGCGFSGR